LRISLRGNSPENIPESREEGEEIGDVYAFVLSLFNETAGQGLSKAFRDASGACAAA